MAKWLSVGHLPMEISRVAKFLLDRRANVSAKLTSAHHRRSPVVQLVETLYTEPKKEEILGTLLQLENTGEQDLAPVAAKQKKEPKCPPENDQNKKDIRSYFAATPRQATKKPESPNVITID